ncbi:ABC transporter ATP-binding protein [Aquincola tertiaricarbonis]|uniref:ABC transporter ATP-binding protein n=1 Tax=Aquincola tertiaricarbonis TaxID=391953 RepID=A0ABY4S2F1_AQUTE|nr:ABC transporter ATP-binding protein [Aquincola tertiaricarbonis]URI06564.1 ABC transporter ATP-binding protein [Aquincola tertiaricarbonis]
MAFLTLSDVSKYYGATCAVQGMNLAIEQGEFVSLLGPSGCGKTTTLQMVAGFVPVSSGRITLAGRDITHAAANTRGLGIVFQSYALFPHMTVEANVGFGLEMRKLPAAERQRKVKQALELVHLSAHATRYPRELSGGQRQRVALARALVIEPPVLLLDEPLSNLDAQLREEMQYELRRIQRTLGTTTLMVTHDQDEALSISDRVVVMRGGCTEQIGHPHAVYERPQSRFIAGFVGKANLLRGTVRTAAAGAARVALDGLAFDLQVGALEGVAAGQPVALSLRPEKLQLLPAGQGRLAGTVAERYFLGSQWFYALATPAGTWMALAPNDGRDALAEGQAVGIDWPDGALRLLAEAAQPAQAAQAAEQA